MSKKLVNGIVAAIIFSPIAAYATSPGFYMGLMIGPATNSGDVIQVQTKSGIPPTTPATPRSKQFGNRLFIGYQVSQYAGWEAGLDYFTGVRYDTKNVQTCSSVQMRNRGFDVVGKGQLPLGSAFNVYGKLGAALIYQSVSGAINADSSSACGRSSYSTKIRPAGAVGVSYDLSPNWVSELSWNRIQTGGVLKSVDFFALGISYHFVDRYCGQFLCDD